jgi:pyruvate dehydrogenase kinase 2/3/4
MSSVIKVKNWYATSFQELVEFNRPKLSKQLKAGLNNEHLVPGSQKSNQFTFGYTGNNTERPMVPIENRYYANLNAIQLPQEVMDFNRDLVDLIENIKKRHDAVVTTMAQGVREYKQLHGGQVDTEISSFLDRFFLSRIGIRMLIGQHIALCRGPHRPNYVGIICTTTRIHDIAQEAADAARYICEEYYGLFRAPHVEIHCSPELEFEYVPSHLHHMLFELLKNSLRAVVELHGPDEEDNFPPIKLAVSQGREDITVKISDEGGGIPRSGLKLIWTYMYTTAEAPELEDDYTKNDFKAPLAGYGYGLPLTRLYARYFGGDLRLISMEGYGTDAYLHLNRLSDSEEPLP